MQNLYTRLISDGYEIKFILTNKLITKNITNSKKIAIFIDEKNTDNIILEEIIKRNIEIRIFKITKEELLNVV